MWSTRAEVAEIVKDAGFSDLLAAFFVIIGDAAVGAAAEAKYQVFGFNADVPGRPLFGAVAETRFDLNLFTDRAERESVAQGDILKLIEPARRAAMSGAHIDVQ